MRVGVLALQGAFAAHAALLRGLGVEPVEVRDPAGLAGVAALVLPGGESTAMRQLGTERGLWGPLATRVAAGMPVLGTCAGAILLAREVEGWPGLGLGLIDLRVARNAYGQQKDSFTTRPPAAAHARVFIRAPRFTGVGAGVEVLDRLEASGEPVAVRQGVCLAATYHPELAGDPWLHRLLLAAVAAPAGLPLPRSA